MSSCEVACEGEWLSDSKVYIHSWLRDIDTFVKLACEKRERASKRAHEQRYRHSTQSAITSSACSLLATEPAEAPP